MIYAVSGLAGSGKDTVADYIAKKFDIPKVAFADPVREMVADIDPIIGVLGGEAVHYTDAVEKIGYRATKDTFPEARRFFDSLATRTIRNKIDKDYFVNLTLDRAWDLGSVVISDARFDNEKEAIKHTYPQSSKIILVTRDDVEGLDYESERINTDYIDHIISNNGTIEELYERVDLVV